jgi:tetratricopeptide (TPR) repeat protein
LNEAELKSIAINGKGVYQLYSSTDAVVNQLLSQLNGMEQKPITDKSMLTYQYFFYYLLAIVFLLLVVDFFITEVTTGRSFRFINLLPKFPFPFIWLILFSFTATAQNSEGLIKKGNEAYNNKQYELAQENYKKALNNNSINSKAQYNLGNALYRNKKSEDALNAYDVAIQNSKLPTEKQGAFYNKGVVLQQSKKLPECIAAYKDALRLNPADEDARINLQLALQQQQEQKENKEKDKKNQKEEKFKCVFIHFKKWNENETIHVTREKLLLGGDIKIMYDEPWFWKISAYKKSVTYRNTRSRPTIQFDSDCVQPPKIDSNNKLAQRTPRQHKGHNATSTSNFVPFVLPWCPLC